MRANTYRSAAILYVVGAATIVLTQTIPANSLQQIQQKSSVVSAQTVQPVAPKSSATAAPAPAPAAAPQPTVVAPKPAPAPAPRPAAPVPAYNKVVIPSIGLSSQFVTVGVTSSDNIDVNPTLVGWWNGSASPGTNGAVFLDGHNPGVFRNLQYIAVGAQITVAMADGSSYTYTVVYRETVALDQVDMTKALTPYDGSSQGLNMMTCMGTYNPATGTTDQRLIVYATR